MTSYVFPKELNDFLKAAAQWIWQAEGNDMIAHSKFAGQSMTIRLKIRNGAPPQQSYLEISMEDLTGWVLPFVYNSDDLIAYYVLDVGRDKQAGWEKQLNLATNRLCSKMAGMIKERPGGHG